MPSAAQTPAPAPRTAPITVSTLTQSSSSRTVLPRSLISSQPTHHRRQHSSALCSRTTRLWPTYRPFDSQHSRCLLMHARTVRRPRAPSRSLRKNARNTESLPNMARILQVRHIGSAAASPTAVGLSSSGVLRACPARDRSPSPPDLPPARRVEGLTEPQPHARPVSLHRVCGVSHSSLLLSVTHQKNAHSEHGPTTASYGWPRASKASPSVLKAGRAPSSARPAAYV